MSWVSLGSADLIEGSTVRGYVYFEYDDTTTGTYRGCRLRIEPRSGHSFYVNFNNITVAGVNYGSQSGLTQNSGVFWTGSVAGGQNVTASWTNPWYAGTKTPSITGYLPAGAGAPSGVAAALDSITDTVITVTGTVTSYGSPTGSTSLSVFVSGNSSLNLPRITSTTSSGAMSYTAALSGSSSIAFLGSIEISPNNRYYIGARASNESLSTSSSATQVVTLPAYITTLSAEDLGSHTAQVTVSHGTEGSFYTVNTEYSLDGSTWTSTASDTFQVSISAPTTTVYVKRTSTAGSTPVQTLTLTDFTSVKLYCSVNDTAEEIVHLYGSVNGESVALKKLYASVNGESKLIFEDSN